MEPLESLPSSPDPAADLDAPSSSRPSRLTSAIVAGGAAVAMVLAGLGIASAQTGDSTTTTPPPAATAPAGEPAPAPGAAEPAEGDAKPADGRAKAGRCHDHHGAKVSMAVAAATIGITEAELRTELRAGKTIAAVATEKGVAVEKVVAALVEEAKRRLAEAVTAGKITQAEADERSADLAQRITDHVNRTPPAGGHAGGKRHHGPGAGKPSLSVAASAIGIGEDELRTQLRAGKTLAAVAGEKGVAVEKLVAALVEDAKKRLAEAVTAGKITQAQADERSANLTEHVTNQVNRTGPAGARHGRSGPGGPGTDDGAEPRGDGAPTSEAEPARFID